MKKALFPIIALVLVLGLVLIPTALVSASNGIPDSAIQIEKTEINGLTAAYVGDTLRYEYHVYIPAGNQSISNVTVTDDNGTPGDTGDDFNPTRLPDLVGNNDDTLEDGETWLYRSPLYTITGQTPDPFQNSVTATGLDEIEEPVEGNSGWEVDILHPPPGVGGDVQPVNKVSVLAPWLGSILILVIGGSGLVLRRRRAH